MLCSYCLAAFQASRHKHLFFLFTEAIKGQIECLAEDDRYKGLSKCLEQCARMIPDTDFTVDEAFQHNQDKKGTF